MQRSSKHKNYDTVILKTNRDSSGYQVCSVYNLNVLDKGVTHVLGGMEQEDMEFRVAQSDTQFKT